MIWPPEQCVPAAKACGTAQLLMSQIPNWLLPMQMTLPGFGHETEPLSQLSEDEPAAGEPAVDEGAAEEEAIGAGGSEVEEAGAGAGSAAEDGSRLATDVAELGTGAGAGDVSVSGAHAVADAAELGAAPVTVATVVTVATSPVLLPSWFPALV